MSAITSLAYLKSFSSFEDNLDTHKPLDLSTGRLYAQSLDQETPLFQEIQHILATGYGIRTLSNGLKIHLFSEELKGGNPSITKLGSLILSVTQMKQAQDKPTLKTQLATLWKSVYKKDLASTEEENTKTLADFQNRLDESAEGSEKAEFEECIEGIEDAVKPNIEAALKENREYKIKGLFKDTLEKAETWLKDFEALYKKMESTTPKSPPSQAITQTIQGNISDSKNFIQAFSGTISGNLNLGDTTHTTIQGSQYNNTNSKIGIQGDHAHIQTMNL